MVPPAPPCEELCWHQKTPVVEGVLSYCGSALIASFLFLLKDPSKYFSPPGPLTQMVLYQRLHHGPFAVTWKCRIAFCPGGGVGTGHGHLLVQEAQMVNVSECVEHLCTQRIVLFKGQ